MPGSALGCATLELIAKHGFPAGKRLGAGVVDGRSVWADGDAPTALLGSLVKQVQTSPQHWHPSAAGYHSTLAVRVAYFFVC